MLVLDVESVGLEDENSPTEFGAVEFENPQNTFEAKIIPFEGSHIHWSAIRYNDMPKEYILSLFDETNRLPESEAIARLVSWAFLLDDRTIVGQNPMSLDYKMIRASARRAGIYFPFSHRTIDIGSIVSAQLIMQGEKLPVRGRTSAVNSQFIQKYVNLPDEDKPHTGLGGAKWETEALWRLLRGQNALPEFASYSVPAYLQKLVGRKVDALA
jgi:DNA polymerase III epsilon subunit-like protein